MMDSPKVHPRSPKLAIKRKKPFKTFKNPEDAYTFVYDNPPGVELPLSVQNMVKAIRAKSQAMQRVFGELMVQAEQSLMHENTEASSGPIEETFIYDNLPGANRMLSSLMNAFSMVSETSSKMGTDIRTDLAHLHSVYEDYLSETLPFPKKFPFEGNSFPDSLSSLRNIGNNLPTLPMGMPSLPSMQMPSLLTLPHVYEFDIFSSGFLSSSPVPDDPLRSLEEGSSAPLVPMRVEIDLREMDESSPSSLVQQYASRVLNFSSQYGPNCYSADNAVGPPSEFPQYGDFTKVFAMRSYGDFGLDSETKKKRVFYADFIELLFEEAVQPVAVEIYETFNPGGVVRISSFPCPEMATNASTWEVLYQGESEVAVLPASRIFSPPLRPVPFLTKQIRIEFDHRKLSYFTEIDAVQLIGFPRKTRFVPLAASQESQHASDVCYFDYLPNELILLISSFLGVVDLWCFAATCSRFYVVTSSRHRFMERLDCHDEWYAGPTSETLLSLVPFCDQRLCHLDLSWNTSIQNNTKGILQFLSFLRHGCSQLVSLSVACCEWVSGDVIGALPQCCPVLKELNLNGCQGLPPRAFLSLQSLSLEKINLTRTRVSGHVLSSLICFWPMLRELVMGETDGVGPHIDAILIALARNCADLEVLDVWRAKDIHAPALAELGRSCSRLRVLNLGWCNKTLNCVDCIPVVARHCPKLTRLTLSTLRTLNDACIMTIAESCVELEGLDVVGCADLTSHSISTLVLKCPRLRLIDLSFCKEILASHVAGWRTSYPHIVFQDGT